MYKFRGKDIKTGEWVYGSFIEYQGESFILPKKVTSFLGGFKGVHPASVGMWTGLKDKNDKPIYENDLVIVDSIYGWSSPRTVSQFGLNIRNMSDDTFEIIGNTTDNPELLTGDLTS